MFTLAQIELMDNGQIGPVRLFVGGYRCRHHLPPVDPSWSDALTALVVPDDTPATRVQLDRAGNRVITVVVPITEVERLERQITLSRSRPDGEPVYSVFENADTNPTGFVALHADWLRAHLDGDGPIRGAMDSEREEARRAAEDGQEALLRAPGTLNIQDAETRTTDGS